jgi:hypothetical protein
LIIKPKLEKYHCPHHQRELVLREAKHGVNRGQKFWGCPTWSKTACNYTIPYKTPEPTLKEKFLNKIKNKQGKISPLKIVGFVLLIPIYIIGYFIASVSFVYRKREF